MAVSGVVAPRIMLEWPEGLVRRLRLSGYEPALVDHTFTDSRTKELRTRKVMKVYVGEVDGVKGSWEWTIHSKRLMVAMNELLARPDWKDLLLRVKKEGGPPFTRWTVEAIPS